MWKTVARLWRRVVPDARDRIGESRLAGGPISRVVVAVAAVMAGSAIYAVSVVSVYWMIYRSYDQMPATVLYESSGELRDKHPRIAALNVLASLGIVEPPQDRKQAVEIAGKKNDPLTPALDALEAGLSEPLLPSAIVSAVQTTGAGGQNRQGGSREGKPQADAASQRIGYGRLVAAGMAGLPGVSVTLDTLDKSEATPDQLDRLTRGLGKRILPPRSVWVPFILRPWRSGLFFFYPVSDKDLERALLKHFRVLDSPGIQNPSAPGYGVALAGLQNVESLVRGMLATSHSDESVKWWRLMLTLAQGPEQLLLWCLFVWSLATLILRAARRRSEDRAVMILGDELERAVAGGEVKIAARGAFSDEALKALTKDASTRNSIAALMTEFVWRQLKIRRDGPDAIASLKDQCAEIADDEYRSRWTLSWAAKTIPAVGFLGTVRGIMLALTNASSIIEAKTQATQSAAVSAVSNQLGVAFTTTLIALLFGLILSYLDDRQSHREQSLIASIEQDLSKALDPLRFVDEQVDTADNGRQTP